MQTKVGAIVNKYLIPMAFAILAISGFFGAIVGVKCFVKYPVAKDITLIDSTDIPRTVKIVGTLGEPLGNLLLIRGKWVAAGQVGKGIEPDFQVMDVNRRPLAHLVLIPGGLVRQFLPGRTGGKSNGTEMWDWRQGEGDELPPSPVAGETWEMLGVQMGIFNDKSPEAVKEFMGVPWQTPRHLYGLVTPFEYIAMKKL